MNPGGCDGKTKRCAADVCRFDEQDLVDLYASAVTRYERAMTVVDEMISAVRTGEECQPQSDMLRALCAEIALLESRILAANRANSSADASVGQPLMAAAERHLSALMQLLEKVRAAEHAAAQRLDTLSPRLDSTIRGKAMASAYRRHRVS